MRDEIWAGLKNAIERGASLDQAVESFISAGYNPAEVKEAANSIGQGAANIVNDISVPEKKVAPPVKKIAPKTAPLTGTSAWDSVKIDDGSKQAEKEEQEKPSAEPTKTLYVPGSQPNQIQQSPQAPPQLQQKQPAQPQNSPPQPPKQLQAAQLPAQPQEAPQAQPIPKVANKPLPTQVYIPNNGADSTRKTKIIILIILLVILLSLLGLSIIYWDKLLELIKNFYAN